MKHDSILQGKEDEDAPAHPSNRGTSLSLAFYDSVKGVNCVNRQEYRFDEQIEEILWEIPEYVKRYIEETAVSSDCGPMHSPSAAPRKRSMPLARYLLYILIITATISGVSLSRYATSETSSDTARVADFHVTVSHHPDDEEWNQNEFKDIEIFKDLNVSNPSKSYKFLLENTSEAAVRAKFVLDYADNTVSITAPAGITMNNWFTMGKGETKVVTVKVLGAALGNNAQIHVEYEQID